ALARLRQEGWLDPHQPGGAFLPEGKGRPTRLARGRQRPRPDGMAEQSVSLRATNFSLRGDRERRERVEKTFRLQQMRRFAAQPLTFRICNSEDCSFRTLPGG